ncbi:deoxyribose-phosphate aldolase [candidate division KSB1 bacterium]|nr:deoxyribose-phosphate aldolase [candidate division KSB1 bacterium]RQW01839.1 MAG: deoxyribose-phosphate aldolase [candidate division KSB1 bacterium]
MSQHYFEKLITQTHAEYKNRPLLRTIDIASLDGESIASFIDHTLLKPDARQEDILKLCEEAKQYGFASVCINPTWLPLCVEFLEDSDVLVCSVVGFPLGASTTETKALEAEELVALGADEIDMVLNIGNLKDKDYLSVYDDVLQVVDAANEATVKVIIETCLLDEEEKVAACVLCKEAGAHFIKTSTGFNGPGAALADVELIRRVVGAECGVKAAGGIRDFSTAVAMLKAGANRIGASASVAIVS